MKFEKVFLIINMLIWLPYGILCLVNPSMLSGFTGIEMTTATATTEIRAMYGGVQSAVGLICLFGLLNSAMTRSALAMVTFVFSGVACARIIGFLLDSSGTEYTYGAIGFEVVGAFLSFWLLKRNLNADV